MGLEQKAGHHDAGTQASQKCRSRPSPFALIIAELPGLPSRSTSLCIALTTKCLQETNSH